jgi:hypothetical protein
MLAPLRDDEAMSAIEYLGTIRGQACTVRLAGFRPGPPVAGDLVCILVRDGESVISPSGWTKNHSGMTWFFWKIIASKEPDPVMYAPEPREWFWEARAYRGDFSRGGPGSLTSAVPVISP